MNNTVLHEIADYAIVVLNREYGMAAVTSGGDTTIINCFPEGKIIEITITEKEDT